MPRKKLPQRAAGQERNFEVIQGGGPTDAPIPPGAPAIPKHDRRGMFEAWRGGVSTYKIARLHGIGFHETEDVFRGEMDELEEKLEGKLRSQQSVQIHLLRRAA